MDQQLPYPKLYFSRRIVQAKLFIDANYADKIELSTIAGEAHYSKFHFARKFKEIYHRTPHQHLMSLRVEKAKKLLADGLPVASVCTAVGFDELSSFSRLFKREVTTAPSVYQQQQLALRKQITEAPLTLVPHCFAYQYGWVGKEQFRTNQM